MLNLLCLLACTMHMYVYMPHSLGYECEINVVRDDENSPLEAGLHHCGFAAGLTASGPATTITVVDPEVGEVGEAAKVGGYTPPPTAQPLATSAPETVKDGSESSLRQPLLAPPPVAAQPEAATPAWAALPVSGKIIFS